jgi:hypothetical protein
MPKLVLLGGPPGIGKSTAIQDPVLDRKLCLDADQIWDPQKTGERDKAITTVTSVVSQYMEQEDTVLLSWVFAKPELFEPFVEKFSPHYELQQLYLVCEPDVLEERLCKRNTPGLISYALEKLSLIQALPFDKIDTTNLEPYEVATLLRNIM